MSPVLLVICLLASGVPVTSGPTFQVSTLL
jgi:hypothetical protein